MSSENRTRGLDIYTSTIRYSGRDKVDVTVKSGTFWAVKPTWDMVMGYKRGEISEKEYTRRYLEILERNKKQVLDFFSNCGQVTLCCYCRPNAFCHRVLLAKWLEAHHVGKYMGER